MKRVLIVVVVIKPNTKTKLTCDIEILFLPDSIQNISFSLELLLCQLLIIPIIKYAQNICSSIDVSLFIQHKVSPFSSISCILIGKLR